MHIYFVRHGETLLNKKHIHQSPNTPLSSEGREQVLTVAEFLREVNPDALLTSEYTRAVESARIIGSSVGLKPMVSGLFYEIMRPSRLFGKSHFNIETFWYVILSVLHRKNKSWRYTDAENFFDISNRAKKALEYLESLRGTHSSVVVVSHTVFINTMVSYMCKNKILDVRDLFFTFFHIERMKNASVIHVEYNGATAPHTCAWTRVRE
jgi:broad specificity phosphatase PhoE